MDLETWWQTQAEDIAIDHALLEIHWHRVTQHDDHVCDYEAPQWT